MELGFKKNKSLEFDVKDTGALLLLKTAERLFAEHGLEAVSTRLISREAGQKNHSALQYHFGSKDGLIEAILNHRITPINKERLRRLELLKNRGEIISVKKLVEIFVYPFSEELLKPNDDSIYVSTLAQLYSYQRGRDLFLKNRERNRAMFEITTLMIKVLKPLPLPIIHLRLQFMGRQTMNAIAEWDEARRSKAIELDEDSLNWRTENLINFIVGGLQTKS